MNTQERKLIDLIIKNPSTPLKIFINHNRLETIYETEGGVIQDVGLKGLYEYNNCEMTKDRLLEAFEEDEIEYNVELINSCLIGIFIVINITEED